MLAITVLLDLLHESFSSQAVMLRLPKLIYSIVWLLVSYYHLTIAGERLVLHLVRSNVMESNAHSGSYYLTCLVR